MHASDSEPNNSEHVSTEDAVNQTEIQPAAQPASLSFKRRVYLATGLSLFGIALFPTFAGACGFGFCSPMGLVLCQAVGIVYGNFGRALAMIAIMVLGMGAMIGKTSWGLAITVAVGISVVFGAPTILAIMGIAPACGGQPPA